MFSSTSQRWGLSLRQELQLHRLWKKPWCEHREHPRLPLQRGQSDSKHRAGKGLSGFFQGKKSHCRPVTLLLPREFKEKKKISKTYTPFFWRILLTSLPTRHGDTAMIRDVPNCHRIPLGTQTMPQGHPRSCHSGPEPGTGCPGLWGFVKIRDRARMGHPAWLPSAALHSQTLLLHALGGAERKHAAFNMFLAPGGQKKSPKSQNERRGAAPTTSRSQLALGLLRYSSRSSGISAVFTFLY